MSWLYLQGWEVEFWEGNCLDGAPDALSSLIPTVSAFFCTDNEKGASQNSRSGTTLELSMEGPGEEVSTSFQEDSHVKTSALLENEKGLKASRVAFGKSSQESLTRSDRPGFSSKIHHSSDETDSVEFSKTLPKYGTMRRGVVSELPTLGRLPTRHPIQTTQQPTQK